MEPTLSRRAFLAAGLAAPSAMTAGDPPRGDVHRQLLELAAEQEKKRRARFAAVKTAADLEALQKDLRHRFLSLLDGLPEAAGPPPVKVTGRLEADDYTIEKLAYESLPGYFVSALLYLPKKRGGKVAGVLSPCGHSAVGKADPTYQTLHINLAKRGYAVLTYDPVGQGERSQFWDKDRGRSRFNLSCGEHAVLGNPLYLLGTSLARYRIWDGMRGLDYLAARPEVDPKRLGCVGNSGGGTLTAYIAALDPRVLAAVPCCYITTLPRRMGNRIETDPDADPEQDVFGFVAEGIDHAGLLALRVPRPTLVGAAVRDFFPIEGARETFAEAKRLYEVAGAGDRVGRAEADAKHGLSPTLRQAAYGFLDRWLAGRPDPREEEVKVEPRPPADLTVCADGQVNLAFRSRPLLPLALEEFRRRHPKPAGVPLKDLVGLDPEGADCALARTDAAGNPGGVHLLCVNGVEAAGWETEAALAAALGKRGVGMTVADPRGVGKRRPAGLEVKGHAHADPLCGVEENLAYNAFLVGRSLLGMRVADVLRAAARIRADGRPTRLVVCGRRDSGLVACLAAAIDPAIDAVAVEEMPLSYWPLFEAAGRPINAAGLLPRVLRDFGDVAAVLAACAPRLVLAAAATGDPDRAVANLTRADRKFTADAAVLLDWLRP
jgi:cephalosporin-C deacetylase-like acetyl esterase